MREPWVSSDTDRRPGPAGRELTKVDPPARSPAKGFGRTRGQPSSISAGDELAVGKDRSVPSSSSSSAQQARQHLADQLRELRTDAGLTGREFARRAGWKDATKVSQVERANRPASAADVRLWCRLCGASEQRTKELLAEQRAVAGMWVTYQRLNRGGLKRAQESVRDIYERATLMRDYQTRVIPGLLQTDAYTHECLAAVKVEQLVETDDVGEAVAERMDRQQVLRRPGARFVFLIEEPVLWLRSVPTDVHAQQLRHLLDVMRWPSVSLGVIPLTTDRRISYGGDGPGVWPEEPFLITDNSLVNVELVSGFLTVTHPDEVAAYVRAWERLFPLAVHGDRVAAIISRVLESL
ncbi:XRE family transcriptional regulator [Actinomadura sp. KC216]|nr:XRE family transcriptional regulator [Actinomadura sp. KC216]